MMLSAPPVPDQESTSLSGCYGNDVIRTPVRDSIARGGVRFDLESTVKLGSELLFNYAPAEVLGEAQISAAPRDQVRLPFGVDDQEAYRHHAHPLVAGDGQGQLRSTEDLDLLGKWFRLEHEGLGVVRRGVAATDTGAVPHRRVGSDPLRACPNRLRPAQGFERSLQDLPVD